MENPGTDEVALRAWQHLLLTRIHVIEWQYVLIMSSNIAELYNGDKQRTH
ncbi:hypothetical protein EV690_2322 [Celerinatantimonas diazotrophica]|uniref:Uncharacterized protein n=1 Tax=Celerinatantimonas diazotrophica TaxID=412034 RepID=A0A4R1JMC5_9GAMM|nr:hypothetical protein EV690_2322 [Celerinatantimonas diazotrophica]CAG9296081.1 hypothetical protein CEDIAZO_01224 [Celerinatantimonas diazotrophica]